jgi:short-subunit dehydrogenase
MLVELAQYERPQPRPLPSGYRISDLGLLNIAFGFRDRSALKSAFERCVEAGLRPNGRPLDLGGFSVVYVNDAQGTSIELLHVEPWYERRLGFAPRPTPRIAPFAGRAAATRRGPTFGRVAITGAAGGIGRELARLAAGEGSSLTLIDRDAGTLDDVAVELGKAAEVGTAVADFTDLEAVDALAGELAADDELDLLIASAGVDRAQSLLEFDWRQMRDDFSVNVLANLVLLAHLAPAMAARGRGHVTAIISLAGLIGMPYEASYGASKAALATGIESARAELGPRGVTFTNVFPGFVDTAMFRQNAFKHTYSIEPRDAAERIWRATSKRRPTLHFPASEHAKLRLGGLLPVAVRDRLTRRAMRWRP